MEMEKLFLKRVRTKRKYIWPSYRWYLSN